MNEQARFGAKHTRRGWAIYDTITGSILSHSYVDQLAAMVAASKLNDQARAERRRQIDAFEVEVQRAIQVLAVGKQGCLHWTSGESYADCAFCVAAFRDAPDGK